jgi:hypothetical protein
MNQNYEAPQVTDYGTLAELTEALLGVGVEDAIAKQPDFLFGSRPS